MTSGKTQLPEFHPQTVLRDWGNGEGFRLSDALTGVCVFGATGSGKTSGPAKHLAYGYLAAGFGGLVLCAKKEERRQWEHWAAECDRTDDLVIVDASGQNRFNFMAWEASRPEAGGGMAINIVNLLDEIATAISGGCGATEGGGGSNKFWEDALHHMNTNLVDLPLFAEIPVSLPLLADIVASAPLNPEQASSDQWKTESACGKILKEADDATKKASAGIRDDFMRCQKYWEVEFPNLAEKTRSIISLTFSMLARPLVTRPLRELFSADTNIKPEDAFGGKIIIVDLPVQEFRLVGRIANLAWKYCFQVAVLRRTPPTKPDAYYDAYKKKARWIWFFALSVIWMGWIISMANNAYDKAAAETATKTGFSHFWSSGAGVLNSDADNARMGVIMGGVFGLVLVFIVAHIIAGVQVSMKQDAAQKNQEAQNQREQREFQQQMQNMDEQSNQQDKLSKFAQSKQELIMRLGSIDQFVRVLETETDANSRTMALQDAHSQMTKLTASLASEQISRDAFDDPVVREHALETSNDLARIGLANDRLNRDLIRMFKLNAG